MSDSPYQGGGFEWAPNARDEADLIGRGLLWALPIGIAFWAVVAALIWLH